MSLDARTAGRALELLTRPEAARLERLCWFLVQKEECSLEEAIGILKAAYKGTFGDAPPPSPVIH